MASMKYCDKHNHVRFLKKPEESTGFAEIVDFLKGSKIRYALTHNPTIHDSLVKQFWQTATATTLADGTLELRATIDTLEYTITEASVRSKLQLAMTSGNFHVSKLMSIFEGMGNNRIFGNMKRGFRGVPRPLLPAMLPVVAVDQSAGQADQADPTHPHVAEERTMTVDDLLQLVPKLITKAEEFLTELQNLKTQEKEAYPTSISEDTLEILAFRRELDELAQKHLREVPKYKATSTTSVNSGSGPVNTQQADQDDSDMPELTIFNKPQKGMFDEASYDDEGMVYDFNNLPTEVAISPILTLRIHNIHPPSQILGDPKSSVQTRSRVQQHLGAHELEEPEKISEALKDDSWVEAMQEELLQFKLQSTIQKKIGIQ
ncbi:hypothetical protein Tco_0064443 [Tanacetum coccineum]